MHGDARPPGQWQLSKSILRAGLGARRPPTLTPIQYPAIRRRGFGPYPAAVSLFAPRGASGRPVAPDATAARPPRPVVELLMKSRRSRFMAM